MANYSLLITTAIDEINERYAELFGVCELAESLQVNKSYLIRRFNRETGISPGQYLQSVRIARAKELLPNPRYSLEVIAVLCGYSCANYFCKVFKKETGETPTGYRNNAAKSITPVSPSLPKDEENELYVL
jgi:YesN/AraC family two-component response regulator